MTSPYFQHKALLSPPIRRAAYSDRTAWMMAEMSRLAYLKFENSTDGLKAALAKAGFTLIEPCFNTGGTQAFLAKREEDKMAVLAFRGTEKEDPRDIIADLQARLYPAFPSTPRAKARGWETGGIPPRSGEQDWNRGLQSAGLHM